MVVHWVLFNFWSFSLHTTAGPWGYPMAELSTLMCPTVQTLMGWDPRGRDSSPSRKATRIRKQKEQFPLVELEALMSSRGAPSRVIILMGHHFLQPWIGAFHTTCLELWKLMNLKTVTTATARAAWHSWRPSGDRIRPFWSETRAVIPSLCTTSTLV